MLGLCASSVARRRLIQSADNVAVHVVYDKIADHVSR